VVKAIKRIWTAIFAGLLVASCAGEGVTTKKSIEPLVDAPQTIRTSKRFNELVNLPPVDGPNIPIAVYKFADLTGQRKPMQNYASFSSAVTQGGEVLLIKALQDAGKGHWFQPVERVALENLVKERQLIRSQRELYERDQAKPLTPPTAKK
jgi:curli production assembly/transport component CsgG